MQVEADERPVQVDGESSLISGVDVPAHEFTEVDSQLSDLCAVAGDIREHEACDDPGGTVGDVVDVSAAGPGLKGTAGNVDIVPRDRNAPRKGLVPAPNLHARNGPGVGGWLHFASWCVGRRGGQIVSPFSSRAPSAPGL